MKKIDRIGETRVMNNGLAATIIAYRNAKDVDVQFENGNIIHNLQYGHFKRGAITSPLIIERFDNYAKVKNPNSDTAWLMDIEDLPLLGNWLWRKDNAGYITRSKYHGSIFLHRVIMGEPRNMQVDHRDGNILDNRKSNLRICTNKENSQNQRIYRNNTSGYKGVYWSKAGGKWVANIYNNGQRIHLGYFDDKSMAAKAYNEAALKYHGEFARLNKIC